MEVVRDAEETWSFTASGIAVFAPLGLALVLEFRRPAKTPPRPLPAGTKDALVAAQTPQDVPVDRPEQKKTEHDKSDAFSPGKATPSSEALADQPDAGGMVGFDLYLDPVGAMKPGMTFEEIFKTLSAGKSKVTAAEEAAGEPLCPGAQA